MPLPHSKLPPVPEPTKVFFDPFNSSSTGHQRAENRLSGSTSWRESRTYKLAHQLRDVSGRGGRQHLLDLVGAGSANFEKYGQRGDHDREEGTSALKVGGQQDIRGLMNGNRKRRHEPSEKTEEGITKRRQSNDRHAGNDHESDCNMATAFQQPARPEPFHRASPKAASSAQPSDHPPSPPPKQPPQIFRGLTIYLNGSTAPLISDHQLKTVFASHGGRVSLALARRTVTHVILGGTGLAAGKIQKEFKTVRGEGVRYVTAQWVVDSVEAGRRKSESRYLPREGNLGLGGSGQVSVGVVFGKRDGGGGL